MRTRFVLIKPSHAGNVGAAARAMKVMGFDDLVLVAPRWANVLRREETIQRASGALDVLERARIVDDLDQALDGMVHLCATAMTPRDFGPPTRSPREHFELLHKDGLIVPSADAVHSENRPGTGIAFLFGSERYGMDNQDVYRCHVCLRIPANPEFASLNLASALQVVAYEWRIALGALAAPGAIDPPTLADAQQIAGMLGHWERALVALGFLDPNAPRKLLPRLNQLVNRAMLNTEEIHILRGIAKAVDQLSARAGPAQHADRPPKG